MKTTMACLLFSIIFLQGCKPAPSEFPVRWTKYVELKSLDDIDAQMDKRLGPFGIFQDGLRLGFDSDGVTVHTVREYLEGRKKGYETMYGSEVKLEGDFKRAAVPAKYLKNAIPARVSYVHDLKLSRRPLDLPATIGPSQHHEISPHVKEMMAKGKTWREIWPDKTWTIEDDYAICLEDEGGWDSVVLLAWGDFNHDGFEDVLVNTNEIPNGGTYRYYGYVVLTRRSAGGKMEILSRD